MATKPTTTTTTKPTTTTTKAATKAPTPTAQQAAQQAALGPVGPAPVPPPTVQGPRATRQACQQAQAAWVAAALAAGTLPTATMLRLGTPYAPKGGQPNGLRQRMVAAVQQALAAGPITWGQLATVPFTYQHRTLGTMGGHVRAHLPFLLGNHVVTLA